jgi:hypothetical protein
MTRKALIVGFVTWHLAAIVLGALPGPDRWDNFPNRDHPESVRDYVTLAFDGLAAAVVPIEKAVWRMTGPLRRPAASYRDIAGLGQSWAMFANPPQYDSYVRTRYYVQSPGGRLWSATELVRPAHREDRVRLWQSYRDSYRDKAMAIAQAAFYRRRKPAQIAPDTQPSQLPNDLAPIGRYFARRFQATALKEGNERIVRTEVWVGRAPTPGLGRPIDRAALVERIATLQAYYEGPVEQRIRVPPFPPYHGGEREADISWVLEYYEEP